MTCLRYKLGICNRWPLLMDTDTVLGCGCVLGVWSASVQRKLRIFLFHCLSLDCLLHRCNLRAVARYHLPLLLGNVRFFSADVHREAGQLTASTFCRFLGPILHSLWPFHRCSYLRVDVFRCRRIAALLQRVFPLRLGILWVS